MRRRPLTALAVIVAASVLTACGADDGTGTDNSGTGGSATEPAPQERTTSDRAASSPTDPGAGPGSSPSTQVPAVLDFSGVTVDGEQFEGADLAGSPVVLWFWAPWCPTCQGQVDGVAALADEYGDDVAFVGVGSLDQSGAIEDFAADVPADFPHLTDPDGEVWRHFGIVEQSTFVVLDADGGSVAEGVLGDDELADVVADLAG